MEQYVKVSDMRQKLLDCCNAGYDADMCFNALDTELDRYIESGCCDNALIKLPSCPKCSCSLNLEELDKEKTYRLKCTHDYKDEDIDEEECPYEIKSDPEDYEYENLCIHKLIEQVNLDAKKEK